MTLNRTWDFTDTSGAWHTRLHFGRPYGRTYGFAGVAVDERMRHTDGTAARNPFAASVPGTLDMSAQAMTTDLLEDDYGTTQTYAKATYPYEACVLSGLGAFWWDFGSIEWRMKSSGARGGEHAIVGYARRAYAGRLNYEPLELDFMEMFGRTWSTSTHTQSAQGVNKVSATVLYPLPFDPAADFHTYRVDVTANGFVRSVDGVQITEPNGILPLPAQALEPVYPVIVMDVDKASSPVWSGNQSVAADYPASMQLQWLRIRRNSLTTTVGGPRSNLVMP